MAIDGGYFSLDQSAIANEDPDEPLCNQTALEGAMMLDQMESDDAGDKSR